MSKRKLLLADDSVTIQKVVNLTFADEGIEVIAVGDGDAAMEKISEISPDLILADVHMPGLSGYQICEMVRENPATKDIPVILLVGSFEPFDENEAERVGASAYLTKPFQSIRQLVSQVTDLMEASTPTADDAANFVPTPTEGPDTSDIDHLYHKSFTEPESSDAEAGPPRFVDAGMDDDMIETSHAGPDTEVDHPDVATTGGEGDDSYYSQRRVQPDAVPAAPFDSSASDTNAAAASAMARSESSVESEIDQFARTEQIPAIDTQTTLDHFALDEIELLELPPIDTGKTLEFTTSPDLKGQSGRHQAVSLSPELMEIIVEKVVAKLSEKN